MSDVIQYNGQDKWKQKATELLNQGGGNVDDVKVNGTSVVDENKVAQIDLSDYATQSYVINALDDYTTTAVLQANYYNKTEVNSHLANKADATSVYTKTEVNTALQGKADASTTYTKTEVDTALQSKANANSVYTKTEADTLLSAKANASDVYTKTETYSDDEVDALLSTKANTADLATVATSGDYDDLTNKPTIPSTASDVGAIPTTEKGANSGVATLDSSGKVPSSQLDLSGKQDTIIGGASTIVSNNLTASKALISDASGKVAASGISSTELGYLDGLTRNITQYYANKTYSSTTTVDNMRGDAYNGAYWLNSTQWSGMPSGSYGYLEVMGNMQRWTAYATSGTTNVFTRMYINGTWTAWKRVGEGYNAYGAWQKTSAVSISNSTNTTIISDITLTAGVWCITATAEWAYNASGIRRIYLTNSSTSTTPLSYMRDTRIAGTDSNQSVLSNNFSMIVNLTASTTLYLRAVQTSGSTLSINSARVATARIL